MLGIRRKYWICIVMINIMYFLSNNVYAKSNGVIYGCTTFTIVKRSNLIFGRNLDVDNDFGNIIINPRGLDKVAYFSAESLEIPVSWHAKFGSISFNQISKDIPHGGMNEEGLVVEHLFLGDTKYEAKDLRPALISHQWVQFMLDNCKSVSEIIELNSKVRISDIDFKFPIHFHVMDRHGDRAIFEFLNGKVQVYHKDTYKIGVLANSAYENSLNQHDIEQNSNEIGKPTDISNSIERFLKAAERVDIYNNEDIICYSFKTLDSVKNNTKWQLVYDIENLQIHYRTESHQEIYTLNIVDFDYSNTDEIKTISVNKNPEIKENWLKYDYEINRNLINSICMNSEFINSILGDEKDEIAGYIN